MEIDERTSREDAHRKRLHEVLDTAFAFYHAVLMNSETGATALAYLHECGAATISSDDIVHGLYSTGAVIDRVR